MFQLCQPFFKLLTLLTEVGGGPSGLPCFTQLVLQHIWDIAEQCPQSTLEWLAVQAPRNKLVASWVLGSLENWVEHFLIQHANQRVRSGKKWLFILAIFY
jgi:ubiquitin carboxyl-terminal hydrolase 34